MEKAVKSTFLGISKKEYYSRFMRDLWVVPDITEEALTAAATAARKARFEFGEKPQITSND